MKPLALRVPSWVTGLVDRLRRPDPAKTDVRTSIANIEDNATVAAADELSASDEAAKRAGSPAEQGGEG